MRYVIGGALLFTGCVFQDMEALRARTVCLEGQEAQIVEYWDGQTGIVQAVLCLPTPTPSTQSPIRPAQSESQRR